MDKIDFELLLIENGEYFNFDFWQTTEERVKRWIENERCRSIFSRSEIKNLFRIKNKIQMVKIEKIKLKKFDKIIVWTEKGNYFVLEVVKIFLNERH